MIYTLKKSGTSGTLTAPHVQITFLIYIPNMISFKITNENKSKIILNDNALIHFNCTKAAIHLAYQQSFSAPQEVALECIASLPD